jgi:hypothetical protein
MIATNKEVLDEIFSAREGDTVKSAAQKDKKEEKPKAHTLRRNVEDYLERKALERKLLDVFDDDFPLD